MLSIEITSASSVRHTPPTAISLYQQPGSITTGCLIGRLLYTEDSWVRIRGTWSVDLDEGVEANEGSDFWWQPVTERERYLTPKNGALFALLPATNALAHEGEGSEARLHRDD